MMTSKKKLQWQRLVEQGGPSTSRGGHSVCWVESGVAAALLGEAGMDKNLADGDGQGGQSSKDGKDAAVDNALAVTRRRRFSGAGHGGVLVMFGGADQHAQHFGDAYVMQWPLSVAHNRAGVAQWQRINGAVRFEDNASESGAAVADAVDGSVASAAAGGGGASAVAAVAPAEAAEAKSSDQVSARSGPAVRSSHSCVAVGSSILVFGGQGPDRAVDGSTTDAASDRPQQNAMQFFNDLWLYDLAVPELGWTPVPVASDDVGSSTNGLVVPRLSSHSACALSRDRMVVFGGSTPDKGPVNSTYMVTLAHVHAHDDVPDGERQPAWEAVWMELKTTGDVPTAREMHAAVVLWDRWMVVSGGRTRDAICNDVHVLDLATLEWSKCGYGPMACGHTLNIIECEPQTLSASGPQCAPVSCKLAVFGGTDGASFSADLHIGTGKIMTFFEASENTATAHDSSSEPQLQLQQQQAAVESDVQVMFQFSWVCRRVPVADFADANSSASVTAAAASSSATTTAPIGRIAHASVDVRRRVDGADQQQQQQSPRSDEHSNGKDGSDSAMESAVMLVHGGVNPFQQQVDCLVLHYV